MGKIKRMDQIRLILRTYDRCGSFKETARRLKMSKNTVKQYVKIALQTGEELDKIAALDEEDFSVLFILNHSSQETELEKSFLVNIPLWLKELTRPGVSRQLIWEEYRKDNSQGYSYSQFCAKLKRHLRSKYSTLALTHKPGDTLQIDFAGIFVPQEIGH